MEKRNRSSLQTSAEQFLTSATKSTLKSIKPSLKSQIHHISSSSDFISTLPLSLHQSIIQSIDSFKQLLQSNDLDNDNVVSPSASPPTKKLRKSSRRKKNTGESTGEEENNNANVNVSVRSKRDLIIQSLEIYTYVTYLCVTHPKKVFESEDFLKSAQALHDNLLLFEAETSLLVEIAKLCEEWWKEQLPGRETLISQSLPFWLSKSLTLGKKVDVHRVYALREAFALLDFDDESIEDVKNLLLRCVIEPLYQKLDEGRRFVAFLFGLSGQLMKEVLALIRSQIPFGRKSTLEAYADILFRAWKVAEGSFKEAIEDEFLQGLIEGAIYASSESLSASIRRVLGEFVSQRTVAGVEKLLFRLTEPVIFRSLQVANSNVRKNALHLLLDMFPLEDPDSTKDVKDALIDKQFFLLERLLIDDCPDVRVVAVEGSCRILYLFWEIIPSSSITKTITKIVDDMSHDGCTEALLPRLRHLLVDSVLSIRVSLVDLLLTLSEIHTFQFHKVVGLDALLSSLSDDHITVAQKITRLLIPSYFPSNLSKEEACARCITLIKRSPTAGARLCEFALTEGSSPDFLMELAKFSFHLAVAPSEMNTNQIEGLLVASCNLCKSLVTDKSYKASLQKLISGKKLMQLFSAGATKHAQIAIYNIASLICPDDVTALIRECMVPIKSCAALPLDMEMQSEIRSVHKLMISCGRFDEIVVALTQLLQIAASGCHIKFGTGSSQQSAPNTKQKKAKLSKDSSVKTKNVKGNKANSHDGTANFQEHYATACGAAWQIKDLLTSVDSRDDLLKSPKLEAIFSALKLISEVSIEQCMRIDYMDTSPVLAYTALALHAELHNAGLAGTRDLGNKKNSRPDRCILKGNALENALNHLFACTKRLFTDSESGDPCSAAEGGSSRLSDKKSMVNMVKMVTEVLKFIVDATSLCPTSANSGKCLQFASACVQVVIPTFRKHSHDTVQLNEDMKGTLLCLKSSLTYAVKLLNVVLRNKEEDSSMPIPEAFNLANNLLNLVMSIESYFGSRNAICLVPAIKPWVLDLILALGSSHLMTKSPNDEAGQGSSLCCLPWLKVLGKLELYELSESTEDEEDEVIIPGKNKFSVFKEVMEMIVVILRRNLKILDSVGVIFLSGLMLLMEKEEYELALGIVHFLCAKLVHGENGEWGELHVMLASLQQVYPEIRKFIRDDMNEEQRQMVEGVEALLEPVWTNHVPEQQGEEV
ncbi:hypothetical protein ACHQM5_024932 [Ranunculus cassubicifolius]